MKQEFIPPQEQALALKELGFDEPCLIKDTEQGEDFAVYYVHQNGRPTFSQAFRWFREKYGLWNMIYPRDGWNYVIQGIDETISCTGESFHNVEIKSYEEAELACLKKLIEIVK